MRIVADRNMPFAAEAFETLGETVIMDGRRLTAPDVRDAEVLAIRSTTRVNAALLDGSRVRFVGTATIGTDHMDIAYLESRGIGWCFSPGCNANTGSRWPGRPWASSGSAMSGAWWCARRRRWG
jgi:erythronate-4-phosphate dehydrogenase